MSNILDRQRRRSEVLHEAQGVVDRCVDVAVGDGVPDPEELEAAIDRYNADLPFRPWLRTIAINKVRDLGRRSLVRRLLFGTRTLDDHEAQIVPDASPSAEDSLAAEQSRHRLDRAIAALPANLKQALLLTAFEDFSHEEAAQALGISVKAVETRVYRARHLLSERLGNELRLRQ